MNQKFYDKDELGLFAEDVKIPYVGITLTAEQAKLIENRQMEFYSIDGNTIIPVRKDGKETGDFMFFVMFK